MLRSLDAVLSAFVLLCLQMCSGSVWYFAAYWAAVFVPGVGIVWVALAGSGGVQSGVFLQDVGLSGAQGSLLDPTASSRRDILQ